ncbi:MAG TPA: VIT and VWA domain-containing protein [Rhodocyclaceae bacterium]|nr:VIT and VWA domain-containing protein [Rhodocyclaceae bacterium]
MSDFGLMRQDSEEMIALKGVEVITRIAGLLAETRLTQKYRNDTPDNLELAYTFPLPLGATLLSFAVKMRDKHCIGEVIPRSQAEVDYEEAIAEGNSAFRLQEIQPGMYNATLGNVLPGEAVEIMLSYAETLAWNGNAIRYRLPTTIAPRYGEPTGIQPWQRPLTSLAPEYPLALCLHVQGTLALSAVSCPSHPVAFKPGPDSLRVTLASGACLDRDFILEIRNEEVQSLGVAASARDTHVAMLTLLPPAVDHPRNDRDTVFVIDCSGSMAGDSLALAKEGLHLSLGSLDPAARFGIVAFGSRCLHFDQALQPANRNNLDLARRWVGQLGDLGGTELEQALETALAFHAGRPMDILLLTDGQAWNLGGIIAKAQNRGVRIFTVGIGSAVAEQTVRSLADETAGACELVSPNEDMSERIFRHFTRMRQPKMEGLGIAWPMVPLWETRPATGCFAGDAYTVAAAFPAPLAGSIRVEFQFADSPSSTLSVPMAQPEDLADAMVRVAARKRLNQLPETDRQDWAIKYQLITDQTDCLIKVERAGAEKSETLPQLQAIPQMLPAGWGGSSSARYMAFDRVDACIRPDFKDFRQNSTQSDMASSCDFSMSGEVPAVIRKRNVTVDTLADIRACRYSPFIRKLNSLAGRKIFRGLPTSVARLIGIPLPDDLQNLLDELGQEGVTEEAIVLAFYQAILTHAGQDRLTAKCRAAVTKLIGNRQGDADLVARWITVLDQLHADEENGAGSSRHDILAFLRKQAE